ERNLYLTTLLKELDIPVVVVLNMLDVAERRGISIDVATLSHELGLPIVECVGARGVGVDNILPQIISFARPCKELPMARAVRCENVEEARNAGRCKGCSRAACEHASGQIVLDSARYAEVTRICSLCVAREARSYSPIAK
ncbi:MAG: hypothetical protein HUK22_00090, partial [Thermoguttaceae bacterium]|nr:hypothetical protein [Thermoguttaceae bacterium]